MSREFCRIVFAMAYLLDLFTVAAFAGGVWFDFRWAITAAITVLPAIAVTVWAGFVYADIWPDAEAKRQPRRPKRMADEEWIAFQEWRNGIRADR